MKWIGRILCIIALPGIVLAACLCAGIALHNPDAVPDDPIPPGSSTTPKPEDWRLRLVNAENPLDADFSVETVEVERGYRFDARAASALTVMLDDCRAAGLHPLLCSAYRTHEYQQQLFEKQLRKQQAAGLIGEAAEQAAGQVIAVPGTSEHELGLAADICSMAYQLLDEGQEQTPEYQWLAAHCAEYGFILRYPPDSTEQTGIIYEPWHFRYVGREAAAYITAHGMTLEEYWQN